MGKDLIIGAASNYTWDHLKHWVNSIKKSGFTGDIVVVATNIKNETLEKLASEGVGLYLYGKKDENDNYVSHTNNAPHVERFFYLWNFLNTTKEDYDLVVATDTRDVIFQINPTEWYDECIFNGYNALIASSEGIKFKDEPWNNQNLLETFGPFFHNLYKDSLIYNVGVLAGEKKYIQDLLLMIFQMSINRPIPVVDQAVYNFLLQQEPYRTFTKYVDNSDAWAAQLGVTEDAIKSGSGDIGKALTGDISKSILYQMLYQDKQPTLREDGVVVNHDGKPFVIVHQYDRTHSWKDKIMKRYE